MVILGLVALLVSGTGPVPVDVVVIKGQALIVPVPAGAEWAVVPADVVRVERDGPGKVRITALRDWFDMKPRKEPRARVRACAADRCVEYAVTCLIDTNGVWNADLVGKWLGVFDHKEKRTLRFVQEGRTVVFEPDPGKPARLRLDGNRVRLMSGGKALKVFDGTLFDRKTAGGRFASTPGFSGAWKAVRP